MPYLIEAHPLLSTDARALAGDELAAHGRVAEDLLGLAGTSLSGTDGQRARDAIVRQVNFQLALGDGLVLTSEGRGRQSRGYRSLGDGSAPTVDPVALRMARQLLGANAFSTVRSVR